MANKCIIYEFQLWEIYEALRKVYGLPAYKSVNNIVREGCGDEIPKYGTTVLIQMDDKNVKPK